MPESAQAASTAARVAEPSYGEIHVAASASRRDILRPAIWRGRDDIMAAIRSVL